MNKKEFKEMVEFLEEERRDLKGVIVITLDKKGLARSFKSGNLNFVEMVGLAVWYGAMVERDFMVQSWRDSGQDAPPGGLVV